MGEEEDEAAAAAMLNPDKAPGVKKPDAPVDPAGQGNKSKEQLEMEEALAQRIRPLNLEAMDTDQLRDRVQEYWRAYTSLKGEKAQLERRFEEQSHGIKEAQEKMAEIVLAKQAKKGVDMAACSWTWRQAIEASSKETDGEQVRQGRQGRQELRRAQGRVRGWCRPGQAQDARERMAGQVQRVDGRRQCWKVPGWHRCR